MSLLVLPIGRPCLIQLEPLPGFVPVQFGVIGKLQSLVLPVDGFLKIAGFSLGRSKGAEVRRGIPAGPARIKGPYSWAFMRFWPSKTVRFLVLERVKNLKFKGN